LRTTLENRATLLGELSRLPAPRSIPEFQRLDRAIVQYNRLRRALARCLELMDKYIGNLR
jgi:hypothetical protein